MSAMSLNLDLASSMLACQTFPALWTELGDMNTRIATFENVCSVSELLLLSIRCVKLWSSNLFLVDTTLQQDANQRKTYTFSQT
jgi:hypothetical protein